MANPANTAHKTMTRLQRRRDLQIVAGYLEETYETFQAYLEGVWEIEGSEAEGIIDYLKEVAGVRV